MDDCFCDSKSVAALRAAGFVVEEMPSHFPQNADLIGRRAQSVKDPEIIGLCHKRKWLIVTKDSNMRITHVEAIKRHPNTMILATSHNPCCDVEIWIQAILKAQVEIRRKFKTQARPWYAQFNRQGKITVCKSIVNQTTHRIRPNEQ
jgi:hypothetical protein